MGLGVQKGDLRPPFPAWITLRSRSSPHTEPAPPPLVGFFCATGDQRGGGAIFNKQKGTKVSEEQKVTKKEIAQKAFDVWLKTAMARMGMAAVGVPEEKKESLKLLLECCFESSWQAASHFAVAEHAEEISSAICAKLNKELGEQGKAIIVNGKGGGIPQPGHGEA